MAKKTGGLGQGLDALFYDNSEESRGELTVRLSEIEPNRDQPRKTFDPSAISELAESIRQHGLIQPIVVRSMSNGRYQIIAGERRWRACREAGLERVPVVVRDMDDKETAETALIENLQREDLSPLEEARGYKALIDTYGLTQEEVAATVGKSRPAVANALRLLGLNKEESAALEEGKISAGHARALLALDGEMRAEGLRLALGGASVREIEKLSASSRPKRSGGGREKCTFYKEVELAVARETGRRVTVTGNGTSGNLHIEFYNNDDLCELAEMISGIRLKSGDEE